MIIEELQKFGFKEIEARVYLELVKAPNSNGSQLAKSLNLPRTSVYSALDNLYEEGIIFLLPNQKSKTYKAVPPTELLDNLKDVYMNSIETLESEFDKINIQEQNRDYINIKGEDNVIEEIKKMLKSAEKEIYLNTNYDLDLFEEELKLLEEKSVRVILFSFHDFNLKGLEDKVEFYHHHKKEGQNEEKRMMLVVDEREVLIANKKSNGELLGTITENNLLVSIVAEHIHHDIYLLKLKEKYGENLIDEEIKLNSHFELSTTLEKTNG
ncbi:TrmB family transcriptional regulator [Halanaerobacter jeridensis]|uniref:Sugar-specific transcriptional regulator TrmB n=1 Tax=Halanaerobacter jeridensis TaxID=706427 RepID=A0A938XVL3_9FIRM|nr:TrmB family transcriptional regulator [Halanaerobacter jeridensis]MBM7556050.1 sugar-specific transcriptional regulator TrmB [Halanaerobacter jeridensis]